MPDKIASFSEILKTNPGLAKIHEIIKESDVVNEFGKILPDIVKIASAVKVEKKTLFLRVEDSVWRNELRHKENIILEKVNKYFNENRINKVKFIS